jgi:hypothetical protein
MESLRSKFMWLGFLVITCLGFSILLPSKKEKRENEEEGEEGREGMGGRERD